MRELGIRMGMPHSWIGKVETGERRLDVEEFVRISRALEIDIKEGLTLLEAALPVIKPIAPSLNLKPRTVRRFSE